MLRGLGELHVCKSTEPYIRGRGRHDTAHYRRAEERAAQSRHQNRTAGSTDQVERRADQRAPEKNRALEDRAARLSQSEENERKLSEFIGKLTEFYESRFAYLMDQFNAGELRESDYEKWGEGKQYAIIETRDGEERVWKAIVEESEQDD